MDSGENSFRARGVTFVLSSDGRVTSMRGYDSELRRLELKSTRNGHPLRSATFDEAAYSLGFKTPEQLAEQLRNGGMTVTEAPRDDRGVFGGLRFARR